MKKVNGGRTDRRTDGPMDRRTDGPTDRWTDIVTYRVACMRLERPIVAQRASMPTEKKMVTDGPTELPVREKDRQAVILISYISYKVAIRN